MIEDIKLSEVFTHVLNFFLVNRVPATADELVSQGTKFAEGCEGEYLVFPDDNGGELDREAGCEAGEIMAILIIIIWTFIRMSLYHKTMYGIYLKPAQINQYDLVPVSVSRTWLDIGQLNSKKTERSIWWKRRNEVDSEQGIRSAKGPWVYMGNPRQTKPIQISNSAQWTS
jgi:hypothetical protein